MTYVEVRFGIAEQAMMCEKKLQAIRVPHVEMSEDTTESPASGYVLQADIPQMLLPLAQMIIQDHAGEW